MIFSIFKEAYKIALEKHKANKLRKQRKSLAKRFNDMYTYRFRYNETDRGRLDGTGMYGYTPEKGYAWMCPDCNKIHEAESCSVFSGLQFPACCSTPNGHRLYHNIRTK